MIKKEKSNSREAPSKKPLGVLDKEMKKLGIEPPKKETKEAPKIKKMPKTFSVSQNLPKVEVLSSDFKIKEVKSEKKTQEQDDEEPEFFNGEFTEEILTAESRGRALPVLMSGMIQEKPIDSLEEFAETLPTPEEKTDKGYTASKYGFGSYTAATNYEANEKKDYESKASPMQQRTEQDRTFTSPSMQSSSTREQESRESLEKFSQQQQQYQVRRDEENQPAFRHKDKRE
ncbi:MAG: hypothetical protein AABX17_00760 [Nanoarchaeota archaeon]